MSEGAYIPDQVPDEFWDVIEACEQDPTRLREILDDANRGTLLRFGWNYEEAAAHLKPLFFDSGLSEDGIHELCNWIVAQGRDFYRRAWDDPGVVPIPKDDPGLLGEAVIQYERRFGEDMPVNRGGFV
jgi:hypothetical protein